MWLCLSDCSLCEGQKHESQTQFLSASRSGLPFSPHCQLTVGYIMATNRVENGSEEVRYWLVLLTENMVENGSEGTISWNKRELSGQLSKTYRRDDVSVDIISSLTQSLFHQVTKVVRKGTRLAAGCQVALNKGSLKIWKWHHDTATEHHLRLCPYPLHCILCLQSLVASDCTDSQSSCYVIDNLVIVIGNIY